MKKAQIGMEYIVVVGIALLILVPVWTFVKNEFDDVSDDLRFSYVRMMLDRVRQAADLVYVYGDPSRVSLQVYVPAGVENSFVNNGTLYLNVSVGNGYSGVSTVSIANLTGLLPTAEGYHQVVVSAGDGYVNISY